MRNPWPVIVVDDMCDYSVVDNNRNQYVWLVNRNIQLRDDFPLSWIPEVREQDNVHLFPHRRKSNNRIVLRDAVKLVPTGRRVSEEINQSITASYEYNIFNVYFVGNNDKNALSKFKARSTRFKNSHLILKSDDKNICKQVLRTLSSSYAWMIDLNAEIDTSFQFDFTPDLIQKRIYTWEPQTKINLYPIEYFLSLGEAKFSTRHIITD